MKNTEPTSGRNFSGTSTATGAAMAIGLSLVRSVHAAGTERFNKLF